MAWVSAFKLGRPGYEASFDVNPEKVQISWARTSSKNYTLSGRLKERVLQTVRPTARLNSKWFPKNQLDLLVSLLAITDTQLSFITRTDWNQLLEPNIAPNTTTVQIQDTSITRLSAIYAAGGFGTTPTLGTVTISGVYINPDGSGTNYYAGGGTYADATNTITLGSSLPQAQQVYVSYTYPGWLVQMDTRIVFQMVR